METEPAIFPAGCYLVGDPMFVLEQDVLEEVCLSVKKNLKKADGAYKTKKGMQFACFVASDRFIDEIKDTGKYKDQEGNVYEYESHLMACIPAEFASSDICCSHDTKLPTGRFVTFHRPFTCHEEKEGQIIRFGHLTLTHQNRGGS